MRGPRESDSALHSCVNMLANPENERSDGREDSLDATNLPTDKVSRAKLLASYSPSQLVNLDHQNSDSDSPDEDASPDSNILSYRTEPVSSEHEPPAMSAKALVKEITSKWKDICDNPRLQERYQTEVSRLVKGWSKVPGKKTATFVHHVMGTDVPDTTNIKEFLFKAAVPAQWEQLSVTSPGNNGRTALHDALEKDEANRLETEESERTNFTSFFCQLLRDGIAHKSITRDVAARVIAATDDDGENCLHLALKFALPVAEDIIELADNRTFLQQRNRKNNAYDNGNTPFHDALEFPADTESHSESSNKYLIQAPICPTVSLHTPIEAYAQQNILGSEEGKSDSVCKLCENIEKKYSKLKARQSRIICSLLEKCQDALKIHNTARQSPFIYHVMRRDEFMKKYPSTKSLIAKIARDRQTEASSSAPREGGNLGQDRTVLILGNAGREPPEATIANVKHSRSSTAEYRLVARRTNPNVASTLGAFQDPGIEHKARQREQITSVPINCSPKRLSRRYYKFSEEVEEFLWEKAFCIGGYAEAHRCLFRGRGVSLGEHSYGESRQERAKLERIFTPPDRITESTTDHYIRFKFESTLALVHLKVTPDSADDEPKGLEEQAKRRAKVSRGLVNVFEWLKGRGVKRIIKLVVEDNQDYYCNEMTIGKCLEQLDEIRYLDWKRPDLSAQTVSKALNVVELSLYSSGVSAVLSSWSDAEGLRRLPKGTEDLDQNRVNVENFERKLAAWYTNKPNIRPEVISTIEDPQLKGDETKQTIAKQTSTKSQVWKDTIIKFTGSLQKLVRDNSTGDDEEIFRQGSNNYVKVALLDDGVKPGWEGLGFFLSGFSWPRPSESAENGMPKPFYMCGPQQHGNRMAKLITEACPFIELYVAKIDSEIEDRLTHPSFDVEQAIDAIYWAIGEGVEIISMSWNIKLGPSDEMLPKLEDAIKAAHRERILMFCAASPKKADTSKDKYWPSSCRETISIGAANEFRGAQGYVGPDAEYLFPSIDVIPNKPDGGSSAATALAAGLASLILFCLKMEMTKDAEENEERKGMDRETRRMGSNKADKLFRGKVDKGEPSSPLVSGGIHAAGDEPRELIDKVFQNRTAKPDNKYVDIVDILELRNGKGATFSAVTKLCLPYLNRRSK